MVKQQKATHDWQGDNARKGYTGVGNRLFGKDRKPLTAREAALESRDITLDFSRRGSHTKKANQVIALLMLQFQAPDKMARAFKGRPRG